MNSKLRYIDPAAVRRLRQYSRKEQFYRVLWGFGAIAFRLVPRPFHGVRCGILRLFGAQIGKNCSIANSARIFCPWKLKMGDDCSIGDWALIYSLGEVTLGDRSIVSHQAHLCAGTHDYERIDFPLVKLPVILENECWVCADAFVGPGVTIGTGAIIGASSVVLNDVEACTIVAGNPAKYIKGRSSSDEYSADS